MKKAFQTALLCSVWNSSSVVSSNVKLIISLNRSNLAQIRQHQSQESRCPQLHLLLLKMWQICLFLQNRTNHKNRQRRELRSQIMHRWLLKLMHSDARTSLALQQQRVVCVWPRSLLRMGVKVVKLRITKWWIRQVEVLSRTSNLNASDLRTPSITMVTKLDKTSKQWRMHEVRQANSITRSRRQQMRRITVNSCTRRRRSSSKIVGQTTSQRRCSMIWTSSLNLPCLCAYEKSVVMNLSLSWLMNLIRWFWWLKAIHMTLWS